MTFPKISLAAALAVSWMAGSVAAAEPDDFAVREGDIVFSSSAKGQGQAIIQATASRHTHCGVVVKKDGRLMVLEAVQPVGFITLEKFAAHSTPGTFAVFRIRKPISPDSLNTARTWGAAQVGKAYDLQFRWNEETLYCSELVWKFFDKAGVRLCEPRRFQDYQLEHPNVRKIIDQRYGGIDKLPKNEKVVAPSDLATSPLLEEITARK